MKKIVALFSGLLLISFVLQAQKKDTGFVVELSLGPSFPIGDFGSTSSDGLTDETPPGMAKPGLGAQFSLGYHLNKNVGVLLLMGYSLYARDMSVWESTLKTIYPAATQIDTDSDNWKVAKIMAGGFLETPLTMDEDLFLLTKLTAGVVKTSIPELSWAVTSPGSFSAGTEYKRSLPWAFCYQVNVGLKYKLGNRFHLLLDINSFNAAVKQDDYYYPGTSGPIHVKRKIKLGNVNVMAGVGLSF